MSTMDLPMPAWPLVTASLACYVIAGVGIRRISRGDRITGWILLIGAALCLALPWIGLVANR